MKKVVMAPGNKSFLIDAIDVGIQTNEVQNEKMKKTQEMLSFPNSIRIRNSK